MMSRGARVFRWAGFAATTLLAASAFADDPPAGPPEVKPPAAQPPALRSSPAVSAPRKRAGKVVEPELPEADVQVRVVAPSAQGLWKLHIENAGSHPVRVPADVRLLQLTVESGDSTAKRPEKPVSCSAPAGFRPEGFPDRNALLLAPGDSYVESFDPHLFCFGKNAKLVAGGALVRARYGWDAPKGARKPEPPYAVQGTEFPAAVVAQKQIVAPSLVLSYLPPDEFEELAPEVKAAPDAKADAGTDGKPVKDEKSAREDKPAGDDPTDGEEKPTKRRKRGGDDDKPKEDSGILDENAARLELTASPWIDAAVGRTVTLSLTATNVGHRPALAVVRPRMLGFRIEGPDGAVRCTSTPPSHAVPRENFQTLRPGGSVSMTVLLEEACGRELFRRPGLYKVTPRLHLRESGAELGLVALTGRVSVKEPTAVRVATGPDPFYPVAPKAIRATPPEDAAGAPVPASPASPPTP